MWPAAATTATQRYSPPSLQGRVNAAFMMLILTPQTVSIAAGTLLISLVDYRLLLLIVIAATGACALLLLVRPAAEPDDVGEPGADPEPGYSVPAAASQAEANTATAPA